MHLPSAERNGHEWRVPMRRPYGAACAGDVAAVCGRIGSEGDVSDLTEWLGGIPEPGTSILAGRNLPAVRAVDTVTPLHDDDEPGQ